MQQRSTIKGQGIKMTKTNEKNISYTISAFAEIVGVSRQTVHRWINLGQIQVIEIPGGWRRIPESEVKRFKGE